MVEQKTEISNVSGKLPSDYAWHCSQIISISRDIEFVNHILRKGKTMKKPLTVTSILWQYSPDSMKSLSESQLTYLCNGKLIQNSLKSQKSQKDLKNKNTGDSNFPISKLSTKQ